MLCLYKWWSSSLRSLTFHLIPPRAWSEVRSGDFVGASERRMDSVSQASAIPFRSVYGPFVPYRCAETASRHSDPLGGTAPPHPSSPHQSFDGEDDNNRHVTALTPRRGSVVHIPLLHYALSLSSPAYHAVHSY